MIKIIVEHKNQIHNFHYNGNIELAFNGNYLGVSFTNYKTDRGRFYWDCRGMDLFWIPDIISIESYEVPPLR